MSKPRKTPVPLPGSLSKANVPAVKGPLSQEFIDSSDDSPEEVITPAQVRVKKASTDIAIHKPKTSGLNGAGSKKNKESKPTSRTLAKPHASPKKPTPKVIKHADVSDSTASSEEDEGASDIITAVAQHGQQAKYPADASAMSSLSSSAGSSDDNDSADEIADTAPVASTTKSANHTQHTVVLQATRPYNPPQDYSSISTADTSIAEHSSLFSTLAGKQLWHITAPIDLPLQDLQEIDMDHAFQGQTLVQHRNASYGFHKSDQENNGVKVVLSAQTNGFRAVPTKISHTLHIREMVSLPKSRKQTTSDQGRTSTASITASTVRAPRPQVKGLKMRYFPSGSDNQKPTELGPSDTEDEAKHVPSAKLAVLNGIHTATKTKKRKHDDRIKSGHEPPVKKVKKIRSPEQTRRREEKKARKLAKSKT